MNYSSRQRWQNLLSAMLLTQRSTLKLIEDLIQVERSRESNPAIALKFQQMQATAAAYQRSLSGLIANLEKWKEDQ